MADTPIQHYLCHMSTKRKKEKKTAVKLADCSKAVGNHSSSKTAVAYKYSIIKIII